MPPGGINATDAVGRFRWDGRDEVAVYFGVGLNHLTRGDEGGVLVYKWLDGAWQKARIDVPHPRIEAADIDGDGCRELIVGLFFDRLAVIDFCGGGAGREGGT